MLFTRRKETYLLSHFYSCFPHVDIYRWKLGCISLWYKISQTRHIWKNSIFKFKLNWPCFRYTILIEKSRKETNTSPIQLHYPIGSLSSIKSQHTRSLELSFLFKQALISSLQKICLIIKGVENFFRSILYIQWP